MHTHTHTHTHTHAQLKGKKTNKKTKQFEEIKQASEQDSDMERMLELSGQELLESYD